MADASERVSLLQAAVDATDDGILVVDRTGTIKLVNQRLLALWNLSAQDVEGADERAILDAMLAQVVDPDGFRAGALGLQDQPEREYVDIVRLQDGRVYERRTRPQRSGDALLGRVWSFRDVSDRERLRCRALFLADATRLLVSIDVERALDALAQLMVPELGERCVIDLLDEGSLRRSLAVSRERDNSIALEVHPAVLEGQPLLYQVHSTSCLGVPLRAQHRIVGAMTLAAPAHRKYTQTDLELAEELGCRIALCIENTRLHQLLDEGKNDEVDLGEVVRSVTGRLAQELARVHSELVLDVEDQVSGRWDRARLEQIVTNLLSNAIEFGLGKPIRVSVSTRNALAVLVVSDRGMGMAPDVQARIFQPFERGVCARHRGGLGLFIVKALVDGLGGHIRVESTLGVGSKFTVELPRDSLG